MLRKYILPVIIIVLLCLSFIAGFRIDLTQEKRHSISDFTKDYFTENKNDINVTLYLHGDDLPVVYKKLSQSVIELLNELKSYSGNRLSYTLINPTASEDKNERMEFFKKLVFKGMMPRNARVSGREGESVEKIVYPYALVKIGKKEVTVNLLQNDPRLEWESEENINNSVQALEFEIMDAISKVSGKNKPRIAFLEGHGELHEKQVYDITNSLSEYYNVDRGVIGGTSGLIDNYECLIIAKPTKPFDEKDKFIIDQYIMNGGKVLWLFDPIYTNVDSFAVQPSTTAIANRLNIEDQLFKYGVRVNTDLIQDLNCAPWTFPEY